MYTRFDIKSHDVMCIVNILFKLLLYLIFVADKSCHIGLYSNNEII